MCYIKLLMLFGTLLTSTVEILKPDKSRNIKFSDDST